MSWQKIGITIAAKPSFTGGGLKVRIPKKIVEAYDLWKADMIEVEVKRARKPPAAEKTEA